MIKNKEGLDKLFQEELRRLRTDYVICTALRKNSTAASNCIQCGKCEKHCPQQIEIRTKLKDAKKEQEGPLYRMICKLAGWFTKF